MIHPLGTSLFALGLSYLAALLVGRVMSRIRIPKVTGYLLVGLVLGPSLSSLFHYPALISLGDVKRLQVLSEIALALIMLTIGAQFKSSSLRRWGGRLVILSFAEVMVSFLLVAIPIFLFNLLWAKNSLNLDSGVLGGSIYLGIFIGLIAVATAPAATLLVIREYESDGPVTELVFGLVGQNNLISILSFNIAAFFLLHADGSVSAFLIGLLGPIVLGIFTGFIISIWAQLLEKPIELQLLLLGGVITNLGVAQIFHLDIFLVCFFTGVVLTNASPKVNVLFSALRYIDYPLYIIFFIIAGASLHIADLMHLGSIGIIYIVMRTAGKLLGSHLGARWAGFGAVERKWVGFALLAQAGVAIGLSSTLVKIWPDGGHVIQTIILGSVVFFELVGPISVRHALVQAGEVPVISLLAKRAPEGSFEGLYSVIEHFRTSLGIPPHHKIKSAADIMVKHIMRKNVDTLCENTPFNEILRMISHSKYDRFPITNQDNEFVGVIDYSDIRDVIVDPTFANLVVAKDILKPEPLTLKSDQTLGEALEVFRRHSNITYLPVVDSQNPKKLVGIVSQNDVLAAFRTLNSQNQE